jgi:hypothetical protein
MAVSGSPGEKEALNQQVAVVVHPVQSQDTDEVLLVGSDDTYLSFNGTMAKVMESGEPQWPVQGMFHNENHSQARVKGRGAASSSHRPIRRHVWPSTQRMQVPGHLLRGDTF